MERKDSIRYYLITRQKDNKFSLKTNSNCTIQRIRTGQQHKYDSLISLNYLLKQEYRIFFLSLNT